jgi:hypothetical protein
MNELSAKASQAIKAIRSGTFRPRRAQARQRGTSRLFAVFPQFGFATRYLPIDTQVLLGLLTIHWRKKGHTEKRIADAREAFKANRAEWWRRVFRLERLRGISVPGQKGKRQRTTKRRFKFYMETDGVACSFICRRPARKAAAQNTPKTVPYDKNKTVFRTIDPGMTDIVAGMTPELIWDGRVG